MLNSLAARTLLAALTWLTLAGLACKIGVPTPEPPSAAPHRPAGPDSYAINLQR